jgi:DNA-binding NtrC family response regulator
LPETPLVKARQLADQIIGLFSNLRCSIVLSSAGEATAEVLVEQAQRLLEEATVANPVMAAPAMESGESHPAPPLLIMGQAMREVWETVDRVAASDLPVLIDGETGVGKELVAHAIHQASPRRERPLRCINCGAMLRDLVLSTLFGHERGSFTGAFAQQKGVLEEADGSTLLLDEVGELSLEAQVALLRVLETGRFARLGSHHEIAVNVRIISATHRNLEAMCEAGTFRWDLLYRLNPVTLKVPPLRQRQDELRLLAKHFLVQACQQSGRPALTVDARVWGVLERYQWPGNVRELRNAMERAVLIARGESITLEELPPRLRAAVETPLREESGRIVMQKSDPTPIYGSAQVEESFFRRKVQSYEIVLLRRALDRAGWNKTAAAQQLPMPIRTLMYKIASYGLKKTATSSADTRRDLQALPEEGEQNFRESIQQYEQKLLHEALVAAHWNKAEAARRLGLPMSTLIYKLKTYQLER